MSTFIPEVLLEERLKKELLVLNLCLSDHQVALLLSYLALMNKWNKVYNLTAHQEMGLMLEKHVLDCLTIVAPLKAKINLDCPRVLDVGSGAGLPGVILAIIEPLWRIDCVDTVGKKAAFIQQVALELRLPRLRGWHQRVEKIKSTDYDCVVSRAFASLKDLVMWSRAALAPDGFWCAMKGKLSEDELTHLPSGTEVFHVEQLSNQRQEARCLVFIKNTHR